MTETFSQRLRAATDAHHRSAERTALMSAMIRGRIDRTTYVRYLRNLHAVYEGLEAALSASDHPVVKAVWIPELARTDAIASDLHTLHGPEWPIEIPLAPATADYVDRIRRQAASDPARLASHAYLRYLGDLSGGRMLRNVLGRSLALEQDALAFYDYPGIADLDDAKADYRARFDRLPLDEAGERALVEEAIEGYRAHGEMFATIG